MLREFQLINNRHIKELNHIVYKINKSKYEKIFFFPYNIYSMFIQKKIYKKNSIIIDNYFKSKNVDNLDIFIFGIYGHYTKKGYELIAEKIINIVSNIP